MSRYAAGCAGASIRAAFALPGGGNTVPWLRRVIPVISRKNKKASNYQLFLLTKENLFDIIISVEGITSQTRRKKDNGR